MSEQRGIWEVSLPRIQSGGKTYAVLDEVMLGEDSFLAMVEESELTGFLESLGRNSQTSGGADDLPEVESGVIWARRVFQKTGLGGTLYPVTENDMARLDAEALRRGMSILDKVVNLYPHVGG